MIKDTAVLARLMRGTVIAEHVLVEWPDGTSCRVHQAQSRRDLTEPLLAVRTPQGSKDTWIVFRPADIDTRLGQDLRLAHWQDHGGIVLYSLRLHFTSARTFMKAVLVAQDSESWQHLRFAA